MSKSVGGGFGGMARLGFGALKLVCVIVILSCGVGSCGDGVGDDVKALAKQMIKL